MRDDPIWSEDAERAVIGCVLRDNEALRKVGRLTKASFYHPRYAHIWESIQSLHSTMSPIDSLTVAEVAGMKIDGIAEVIAGILDSTPVAGNALQYADIVREKAVRRDLVELGVQAIHRAREEATGETLEYLSATITALHSGQVDRAPVKLQDVILQRTEHYEKLANNEIAPGWPTKIGFIDRVLNGGLRPGKLIYLAARPAVGKSSFSAQMLIGASEGMKPGLFLSQEMDVEEWADRFVASKGGIDLGRISRGEMTDDDWSKAADMIDDCAHLPIWLDDQPALTLADIRHKVHSVNGIKVVVLDYLQLCAKSAGSSAGTRAAEVGEISRGLKRLAKESGICVISLSQLNREVERRSPPKPVMADLRDSGEIEQDADSIIFLWPISVEEDSKKIGCYFGKNRGGSAGDECVFEFRGNVQRWAELEGRPEDHYRKD